MVELKYDTTLERARENKTENVNRIERERYNVIHTVDLRSFVQNKLTQLTHRLKLNVLHIVQTVWVGKCRAKHRRKTAYSIHA